jgi:microcystin-dependent protein
METIMDELIGTINHFPWTRQVKGWHICDGTTMQINTNQALFSLLGNRFGGDGRSTFALPDLRKKDEHGAPTPYEDTDIVPYICIEGYYPSWD